MVNEEVSEILEREKGRLAPLIVAYYNNVTGHGGLSRDEVLQYAKTDGQRQYLNRRLEDIDRTRTKISKLFPKI